MNGSIQSLMRTQTTIVNPADSAVRRAANTVIQDNRPELTLEAALEYRRRGYWCLPIPLEQKGPKEIGWQKLRLEGDELEHRFDSPCNIGIILGEPSGWLVDVDLDCEEAIELADQFLPPTSMISGREKNPNSHRWYIAEGAASKQLRDRISKKMIVELRSTGQQTDLPPLVVPMSMLLQGAPLCASEGCGA